MGTRLELQQLLEGIVGPPIKVYFQPPTSVKLSYPCIVYALTGVDVNYAGNIKYLSVNKYQVTIIDTDPDTAIPNAITLLTHCAFDRRYTSDNLYHEVYSLYY